MHGILYISISRYVYGHPRLHHSYIEATTLPCVIALLVICDILNALREEKMSDLIYTLELAIIKKRVVAERGERTRTGRWR